MFENRSQLIDQMAKAMNDTNDLDVTRDDLAAAAIAVLERHGLTFATNDDRENLVEDCSGAIWDTHEAMALRGDYMGDWNADAEAVLNVVIEQGQQL